MASKISRKDEDILSRLIDHYTDWREDNDKRQTRKNGWDDAIRIYHNVLPDNWPYLSKITEPIIRSIIQEKNARLFNTPLRGKVVPREGGDSQKAAIHNAVLEYQWDSANIGGSMLEKWALMDIQTRLFGASFGLVHWYVEESNNKVMRDGNEFKVLDNRDVGIDPSATHVKNANWVQVRQFMRVDELENANKYSPEPIYKGLPELKRRIAEKDFSGDMRSTLYGSVLKDLRGLDDKTGTDRSFPVIEVITEYQEERWITFVPRYGMIIRDIPNPYNHQKIPVVMLRYYPNGGDAYGDSEVEPIISMARALNAIHSSFVDAINISTRPPLKVANNHLVRLDTLDYGPNALWLVGDNPNNVMEHNTGDQAIASYRTAVPSLKSAIYQAMGENSQGTAMMDFRESDKTATEVMDMARQRQSRDQQNQMYLTEALKDQMMLWMSNNQQFLFDDPTKHYKVIRILGRENIEQFKDLGFMSMDVPDEATDALTQLIEQTGGAISDEDIRAVVDGTGVPTNPVILNPEEKNPEKFDIRPKLELEEGGQTGKLYITPDDFAPDVYLDYIPDVKSMAMGVGAERAQSRVRMLEMMLNPVIDQKLGEEGKRLKISEFVMKIMHNEGETNPEKFMEDLPNGQPLPSQQVQPNGSRAGSVSAIPGLNATNASRKLVAGGIPTGIPGAGVLP